ncbi:gliding motility protein GldN [Phaeodactylibacter xiamenensis]|uniref:type IX secretion system ring protein PorN/GldN n=1 Tax=Phaeodactylibacter xiamenensis TaxID=1524460 RepID=UPI003BAD6C85
MKYYLIPVLSLLLAPLFAQTESTRLPLNDITHRTLTHEERPLPYPPIREADILWEKRVWRVIDTREKINLPFRYPKQPFVTLLTEAVESGRLQAFSTANDEFSLPLSQQEVTGMLYRIDTVPVYDFDTDTEIYQVVKDELNPEDVKRFRIKEHWFFDTRTSTLQVRILGIAPPHRGVR